MDFIRDREGLIDWTYLVNIDGTDGYEDPDGQRDEDNMYTDQVYTLDQCQRYYDYLENLLLEYETLWYPDIIKAQIMFDNEEYVVPLTKLVKYVKQTKIDGKTWYISIYDFLETEPQKIN